MVLVWVVGVTAAVTIALFGFGTYLRRSLIDSRVLNDSEKLRGKTVLITGATAGIGLATAKALHKMGAHVILTARDPKKSERAIKEIRAERSASESKPPPVDCIAVDLADISSVKQCAEEFKKMNLPLDYLINNAGATFLKNDVTKDGFERSWQTNALSHYLLTTSLLDVINKNKTRVINLSSNAHTFVPNYKPLTYEQVHSNMQEEYGKIMAAYGLSKLCGVLFYKELVHHVEPGVLSVGCNPGFVQTEISREIPGIFVGILRLAEGLLAKSPLQGAYTTLYLVLADSKDLVNGGYYDECKLSKASDVAENRENQQKMWQLFEECAK
jgi:NAD(P)-dependent dehydrogenase (short-subunit alcohol dehydrogenase family)